MSNSTALIPSAQEVSLNYVKLPLMKLGTIVRVKVLQPCLYRKALIVKKHQKVLDVDSIYTVQQRLNDWDPFENFISVKKERETSGMCTMTLLLH